jgi:PAS domain S-box-containing protein
MSRNSIKRLLLVEDNPGDARLIREMLNERGSHNTELTHVQCMSEAEKHLAEHPVDVILLDLDLPDAQGPEAIRRAQAAAPRVPLVVLTVSDDESLAAQAVQEGAQDYLVKGELEASSLLRALRYASERKNYREALREGELRFRQLAETIRDVFFIIDLTSSRLFYVSPAYEEIWGKTCESLYAQPGSWADSIHPDDRDYAAAKFAEGSVTGFDYEYRILRPDGELRWIQIRGFPILDDAGKPYRTAGVAADITQRKHAEEELRRSESLKAAILESSLDCLVSMDHEGKIVEFNPSAQATFALTPEQALGKSMVELIVPPRLRDAHRRGFAHYLATGEGPILGKRLELHAIRSDGTEFPIELTITAIGVAPTPVFTAFIRDITARKAAEEKIERLNRVYAVLSGINSLIVRVRDRDALFTESCRLIVEAGQCSLAWVALVDRAAMELNPVACHGAECAFVDLVRNHLSLKDPPEIQSIHVRAAMEKRAFVSNDVRNDPRIKFKQEYAQFNSRSVGVFPIVGGETVAVLVLHFTEADFFDGEETKLLVELAANISIGLEHIQKTQKLDYLAYYDPLTGLANRTLFLERVGQILLAAGDSNRKVALFALDVERFKTINEALGRQAGDELLTQIADRLRKAGRDDTRFPRVRGDRFAGLRDGSRLARVIGDHFAVVTTEAQDEEQLAQLAGLKLRQCFAPPFRIGESEVRVSAKIGIAVFPGDGADAETLLNNAQAAVRKAKASGDHHVFYTQEMSKRTTTATLTLESKLRQALEQEEFVLHYQPKVDLESRDILGVEALIRWQSPELGLVPPMKFIPLMEETGMILEVGAWALTKAATDHFRWLAMGLPAPRVAVNVSAVQLRKADFFHMVKEAIMRGSNSAGIDLEITESLIMEDIEGNIQKLKEVRALGVNIAIDDFGTGYSSLAYLAKLPVQTLKIDRSFIITMLNDNDAMTLVQTIISLAHSLRLQVVAEGVELEAQAKMLHLLRCDEMQGYLFSPPVPFDALTTLLKKAENETTALGAARLDVGGSGRKL